MKERTNKRTETQPCDLISRQAAIDQLHQSYNLLDAEARIEDLSSAQSYKTDHGYMWICPKCGLPVHSDYDKCVKCGQERPSAQPMRKKGKWHKKDNGQIYWYECSVCGCEPLRNKWNGDWEFSGFCPSCGAEMEGGEDERTFSH